MPKYFSLNLIILMGFLIGCSSQRSAVPTGEMPGTDEASSIDATDKSLPVDPSVKRGVLDNGLTYYIRRNKRPENRAELRLVVNAGSVLEDEDQRGLAHAVEHMAFNGTERFQKQDLIDYLESTGVRFGADLNAYTSFDETVYQLQVQTDSLPLFDTGVEILREWASRITFDPAEIEKERGVVIEEWRLGRGANARMSDKQLPVLLQGSRYAERLPIGTKESLDTFSPEALVRFYRTWYRPDLMAVVVVGDLSPEYVEKKVVEVFSDFEAPESVRPRPTHDVPDHAETLVTIATDDEAPFGSASVVYKHPKEPVATDWDFRRLLAEQLYSGMLNQRLQEQTQSADPPFFGAGSGKGGFARAKEFYNLSAIASQGGVERALEAVLVEAERVRRFGFVESELERQKSELLRGYERAYSERDKTESGRLVREYVGHFLEGEPIPGIEYEYELAKKVVPGIALLELNGLAQKWMTDENRVAMLDGPTSGTYPTAEQVRALFADIRNRELTAYEDQTTSDPLVATMPEAGTIESEEHDATIGVTRWRLSNGVRVVLKPTDFKNDQILFNAFSPGGTSLIPDEMDLHGDFASSLISQSGVGVFDPIALQKKLAGKVVQVSPNIRERSEGFSGSSSPDDLEVLMQLVHLYVTSPRADTTAFASFQQRYRSVIETLKSDPNRVFSDTLSVTMAQHHPRRQILDRASIDLLDLDKSFDIYKDRFADVGDFTFYFVGAFEIEAIRPLVERYVASLPAGGRVEEARDLGVRPPSGRVEREVVAGIEPKSRVQIVMTGPAEWSQANRRLLAVLEGVLDMRLREILREDLGGTYGVGVNASISREPVESYSVGIGFGCEPERLDELVVQVYDALVDLRENGTTADYIAKVREKSANAHEVGLRQNGYWLSSLMFYDRHDLPAEGILTGSKTFFEELTLEDVHSAARKYLAMDNVVEVRLLPTS